MITGNFTDPKGRQMKVCVKSHSSPVGKLQIKGLALFLEINDMHLTRPKSVKVWLNIYEQQDKG